MEKLIKKISIEKLFGLYSYTLPNEGSIFNTAILYGDNGVGKSTLLKLVFHLLSSADDKGHRTYLYKSKFESIAVELVSGHILTAKISNNDKEKVLTLAISSQDKNIVKWDCTPGKNKRVELDEEYIQIIDGHIHRVMTSKNLKRKKVEPEGTKYEHYGEFHYIKTLKDITPTMYFLSADRRLDSDYVSDPSDEIELRRLMRLEDTKNINDLVVRSREIALTQALSSASRWLSRKAVQSANRGTENVHSVYSAVLKHIITPTGSETVDAEGSDPASLIKKLSLIEAKTEELARYEFTTGLSTTEFRKALNARAKPKRVLAANLLQPYISSLESRLNALEPIFKLTDKFVSITNLLLRDKEINFTLSQGFSLKNKNNEPLQASQLSSGEQQLLLLLCYILTARDKPSIFMIDEPEISLNIKWQRQLIQTLTEITDDSKIQFIIASHSMEILAQHRSKVIRMEPRQ